MKQQDNTTRTWFPPLSMLITVALIYPAWLILSAGQAPVHGLVVALLIAAASSWLTARKPTGRCRWSQGPALLRFAGFFLRHSLTGALDVAWRAFHYRMPLQPCWLDYPLRLEHPGARALFLGVVSLTPGTLGADMRGNLVRVHVLINQNDSALTTLEHRIAALFCESLPPASHEAGARDSRAGQGGP